MFSVNGITIKPHAEAASVIAQLGTPRSYVEETSCAFDGLDKTYYYGSFYLSTYPLDGRDYIYRIWLVDDSVTTREGVRIGNTQQQAAQAYGVECFNGSNAFICEQAGSRLTVILKDGYVNSIQYEALLP